MSLHNILSGYTAPDSQGVFGAVVAVADKTGNLIATSAGGRRTWAGGEKPDLDTTYWAYSFTKLLTTIAALQCVERGLIGLDDPVQGVLPELKDAQVIEPGDANAGTEFTLRPATRPITLRHLLTHTSGFVYDNMHPLLVAWRKSRGETSLAMCGDVVKGYTMPLVFEPGESWGYGGGLDWAGLLVERFTGQRLGEYMQQKIFSPMGLTHTTFSLKDDPHAKHNLMDMSVRTPDGKLAFMKNLYPQDAPGHSGGMGIVTSVGDFIKVVVDLIRDDPMLLQPKTRDLMHEPQFSATSKQAQGIMAMGMMHENLTGGEKALGALSFGLGGLVALKDTPNLPAGTLSWNAMPNMGWFANKERGIAAVFGCQMMPPSDPTTTALLAEFANEVWRHNSGSHVPSG